MILVAGGLADRVTELVCARLAERNYSYRLLDLGRYPNDHGITCRWRDSGPEGAITGPGWSLDLADITGVYVRFLGAEGRLPLANAAPESAELLRAEADAGLMALFEDLSCPVVNRAAGGMSNNSKPYQALLLRRAGLRVPPTLVTNDPEAVRAFHAAHGEVVYKSLSGIRSIVRRLGPEAISRLKHLRDGPAQFQAYVPGSNVRVHTVGNRIFAVRVRSDAVDYRYAHLDGLAVEMEPTVLPRAVEQACLAVARDLDLLFAGIDLKETPEGDWYCFEVNPCPGFLYYERNSGLPISAALADLLHGTGSTRERRRAMN
jgi:RimK-like ATP-grasp domain